jgi:molybdopterin converting factor small subunit
MLKLHERLLILKFVNGEQRDSKHQLKNGDDIGLLPPIGGGRGELIVRSTS